MSGICGSCGVQWLPIYRSLDDWLKAERRKLYRSALAERRWTVAELGKRVGYTRQYVSQIVHGRIYRPRAQARIEKVLGMAGEVEVKVKVEREEKGRGVGR
jgi:transcriptional regulator with XRE-family HTH domain